MGAALYIVDTRTRRNGGIAQVTWRRALLIGLAQALAFISGVSRSGATMTVVTVGRALGLGRVAAARLS
jgi:undecaprenyl-diphosphatase